MVKLVIRLNSIYKFVVSKQKSKSLFTIRRIANRNSRFLKIVGRGSEKIWRLVAVVLLIIVGIASLFFFDQNFESSYFGADVADSASQVANFLGDGFKSITGFPEESSNPQLEGAWKTGGVGTINALFYNVKTYFKYIAGSMAVLFFIVAAMQTIVSNTDEGVKKGKRNLIWAVVALAAIFTVDVVVTALYEGGSGGEPGQSFFTVTVDAEGNIIEENTKIFESMAKYFQESAHKIFNYIQVLTGAAAILFIFISGLQVITAGGNEEKIDKEKKYILHALTAFITLLLAESLIFGFIYPSSDGTVEGVTSPVCVEFMNALQSGDTSLEKIPEGCSVSASSSGAFATSEVLGLVKFFESLIGGIAVFFLVYSSISIIASFGQEDIITKHKKQIFWSLAALGLIVLSHSLINVFFFIVDPATGEAKMNASNGVILLARTTNFITTFIGVMAVIAIIIAGFMWVANFGNDEIAGQAKKMILGAVIGVVLSISAYAIVNTLVSTNSKAKAEISISI